MNKLNKISSLMVPPLLGPNVVARGVFLNLFSCVYFADKTYDMS